MKTALVTGITGQDGYYLSKHLINHGYRVIGTSHRGICSILVDGINIPVYKLDLLDKVRIIDLIEFIEPDVIFNLAARASSAQLFDDPIETSEINGVAVVRLLEAIRQTKPGIKFCQASSCEIFSGVSISPQDENTPKMPTNAYGAAKAFGDHAICAYRATHNIFACSAILYPHESIKRDLHFLVRKITHAAATISKGMMESVAVGNLESVRDWGLASDYMIAMLKMVEQPDPQDFIIASGIGHNVAEVCEIAFEIVGLDWRNYVVVDNKFYRNDYNVYKIGNSSKARNILSWSPSMNFREMITHLVTEEMKEL